MFGAYMRNWATSGKVKIDRANEHIEDLERRIQAFRETDPYIIRREVDPEGWTGTRLSIGVRHPIPLAFSTVTADAVHNLATALDQLWANATKGKLGRKSDFPALSTTEELNATREGQEKSLAFKARKLLGDLDALCVDNPFLTIRKFDNSDKHAVLSLVACKLRGFSVDITHSFGTRLEEPQRLEMIDPNLGIIEDGKELILIGQMLAEINIYDHLSFEMAFGQGEVLEGEPVVPTLHRLSKSVNDLATAFLSSGLVI